MVLFNGLKAWLETDGGRFALSSHRYVPDVLYPDGATRIESFAYEPCPRWISALADGTRLQHELFVPRGVPVVALAWRLLGPAPRATLTVRPLLSGRDAHALQRENPDFRFGATRMGDVLEWRPYVNVPGVLAAHNGSYHDAPDWYRRFLYAQETARGLTTRPRLPGVAQWDLTNPSGRPAAQHSEHTRALTPARASHQRLRTPKDAGGRFRAGSSAPRTPSWWARRRRTIVAGYPWFRLGPRRSSTARLCHNDRPARRPAAILLVGGHGVRHVAEPGSQRGGREYNRVDRPWFIICRARLPHAPRRALGRIAWRCSRLRGGRSDSLGLRAGRARDRMDGDGLSCG
jgi:hypothetical protein